MSRCAKFSIGITNLAAAFLLLVSISSFPGCSAKEQPQQPAATGQPPQNPFPDVRVINSDSLTRIAEGVMAASNQLVNYIEEINDELFRRAGGPMKEDPVRPVKFLDSLITTQYFIKERKGYELMEKIQATRDTLIQLTGNDQVMSVSIPLKTDFRQVRPDRDDWVKHNFQNKPVAVVITRLQSLKKDAYTSGRMIVDHLAASGN